MKHRFSTEAKLLAVWVSLTFCVSPVWAQTKRPSSPDNSASSKRRVDFDRVRNDIGVCKEREYLTTQGPSPVGDLTFFIAPCGNQGVVIALDAPSDPVQKRYARNFLAQKGILTEKRIYLPDARATFLTDNYLFVAMGKHGLALLPREEILSSDRFGFTKITLPTIPEILNVAVHTRNGREEVLYVAEPHGIAVIPFSSLRSLMSQSSTLSVKRRGEWSESLPLEVISKIPVSNPTGLDLLREPLPADLVKTKSSDADHYDTLLVTSLWGQIRLYSLSDPLHPYNIKEGGIWTPFLVKRDRKGRGKPKFQQHVSDLSGITVVDHAVGTIVVTDTSGRAESMNLKDYMMITSTTQAQIIRYVSQEFGTDKAFWTGMLFTQADWIDGYYSAFPLIFEGIVDQFVNQPLKGTGLVEEGIPLKPLQAVTREISLVTDVETAVLGERATQWKGELQRAHLLDERQVYLLDKMMEEGEGGGRTAFTLLFLTMFQFALAKYSAPIIASPARGKGAWEAVKWFFTMFGTKSARALNFLYARRLGINMNFRPIMGEHFWRTQIWAWTDALIIAATTYWVRKTTYPDDPKKQLFSSTFSTKNHFAYVHEQYWFDLMLNLVLYGLLMPPALSDKGARGFLIGFSGSKLGTLGAQLALQGRKMVGRYAGVFTVNFLMRAWSDYLVQIFIKKGIFDIPFSAKRHGFDMGYQPSWVIPSMNIAWLMEDGLHTAANTLGIKIKGFAIAAEFAAALTHGIISGVPIEYGIAAAYDQEHYEKEELEEVARFPLNFSLSEAVGGP